MRSLSQARYRARFAASGADLVAARRLRYRAFIEATDARPRPAAEDADAFDPLCRHVLVEDSATRIVVAAFRLMQIADGGGIHQSYAAQFYGLSGLARYPRPMAEVGRFCIAPGHRDPDILRVAWAALARFVDDTGTGMLFGCSSFRGCEAAAYAHAFALLGARHLGPRDWRPAEKAHDIHRFAAAGLPPDPHRGLRQMPPLLRGYLAMGGWVGDHAVVDRDLGTLHVFTGLEVARIPAARARALRALAA